MSSKLKESQIPKKRASGRLSMSNHSLDNSKESHENTTNLTANESINNDSSDEPLKAASNNKNKKVTSFTRGIIPKSNVVDSPQTTVNERTSVDVRVTGKLFFSW